MGRDTTAPNGGNIERARVYSPTFREGRIVMTPAMKQETLALTRRWFLHLRGEFIGVFFGLFQPLLWLLLFGTMFSQAFRSTPLPPEFGAVSYLAFITAGIVVSTVMGSAIAGGIPFMFDKENGFMEKLLAAPIRRESLLISRFLYVVTYSTVQALLVLALARLLGVPIATGWLGLPLIVLFILLLCAGFTLLSMTLAFVLDGHANFFAILGFLTTPLFFVSNALVPIESMPLGFRVAAYLNPLTYGVLAIRAPMLKGWSGASWGEMGLGVLGMLIFDALMLWLAARVFKRNLE